MSEPFADPEAIAAFYAELLAEHGSGPLAVGWNSGYTQVVSFMGLAALDGLESGVSVLDVGCGLGDFKTFIDRRGIRVDYTGWDICEPFIEQARRRHPDTRFEHRDILAAPTDERFDFVVCSGMLNIRMHDHDRWVVEVLRVMYGMCRRAMAFNALSSHHAASSLAIDTSLYYCVPPEQMFQLCLELSPQVHVNHGDMAHAFTTYVYRANKRPVERAIAELGLGREFGPEHRMIAEYFLSLGLHDELIAWLESLQPCAEVHDLIGLTASELGDEPRQLAAFERAVALDPHALTPLLHLGIVHMRGGRVARACELFEQACALAPDDASVVYRLACAYEADARLAEAARAYHRVLALAPEHAGARTSVTRLDKARGG